jgi:hypothetical protein
VIVHIKICELRVHTRLAEGPQTVEVEVSNTSLAAPAHPKRVRMGARRIEEKAKQLQNKPLLLTKRRWYIPPRPLSNPLTPMNVMTLTAPRMRLKYTL